MKSDEEDLRVCEIKSKNIIHIKWIKYIVIQIIIPSYNQLKSNYSKIFIFFLIYRESRNRNKLRISKIFKWYFKGFFEDKKSTINIGKNKF